ncbi:MAG: phosphate ABC transporter permease PstA [Peptococcaceae bacterium]|nr:phosphate ABC transporter permease PstA [Peptococcaceae bacterium]
MRIDPKTTDKVSTGVFYLVAAGFILLLVFFVGYILYQGRLRLNLNFITSAPVFMKAGGGIAPQLFNSLYLVFLSILITVPIGLSAGIYLAEYARQNRITKAIRFCIEALASLPSIVIGLFGLLVFVSMTGWGYTLMSGALAVSILNLPVITRISEDSLRGVPHSYKEASLALGATHWQTITRVLIPVALPGLITGIVMTAGRAFGEAAALLYTAGMSSPKLNFSNWNPLSFTSPLNPFRPAETLAVYIWKVNSEGLIPDARQVADGSAAILVISVFLFNICSRFLGRLFSNRFLGKSK